MHSRGSCAQAGILGIGCLI